MEEAAGTRGPDPIKVERGFRKLYWKHGLKILAGIGTLAIIEFIRLPSKWFALPFILIGAWLMLVNMGALSVLALAQHRYRHGPDDDTPLAYQERSERFLHYASYGLLVIVMFASRIISRMVENIMEEGRFVLWTGGAGITIASFVMWWIKRSLPGYFRNNEARGGAVVALFLSLVGMAILGSAWVDRQSAEARVEIRRYAVKSAGTNVMYGTRYVHLFRAGENDGTFRIEARKEEFAQARDHDSVDVRVGTGDLGFTHVLGIVVDTVPHSEGRRSLE